MSHYLNDKWLESCAEELDLPGSPWYEVQDRISQYLAGRIRVEGLTADELAKMRYLLGSEFSSKYKMQENVVQGSDDVKRPNLQDEKLESLLKELTLKAASDAKCALGEDLDKSPECFRSLVALASKLFSSSIQSQMYNTRMSQYTQYGANPTVLAVNSLVDKEIEILGEALVKILQKDPGRLSNVQSRLRGRLMPAALRRLLYRSVLIKKQKQSHYPGSNIAVGVLSQDEKITQQGLREAFAKGVKAGMDGLKLKDPTKCPLRHLIEMSIIEAYETLPGLKPHSANMEVQRECSRVLNILYTHSQNYLKTGALWLFPLQITISQDRYAKEHDYELAMWLNCVVKSCFPITAKFVNSIASQVWKKIMLRSRAFSEGVDIANHFAKLKVKSKQEDVERILQLELPNNESATDIRRAVSVAASISGSLLDESVSDFEDSLRQKSFWSLSHPVLCIRKWLTDLFVSVTDLPVCMFLWDQFFLYDWEGEVFDLSCLAMFQAIIKDLLVPTNADDLCAAMLEAPVGLKLHEIHRAWHDVRK